MDPITISAIISGVTTIGSNLFSGFINKKDAELAIEAQERQAQTTIAIVIILAAVVISILILRKKK